MRIRINRSVSVHNEYKAQFLRLLLAACESLLIRPIVDTYFRRIDEELVASIEATGKMHELMPQY